MKIPKREKGQSFLKLKGVYLGFKPFGSPGASAACMKNVACPFGSGWEKERNAVGLVK